jgi:hypothetical protein
MDPGHAVGAPATRGASPGSRRSASHQPAPTSPAAFAPRIVPAGGDTQDAAHGGDRMDGLMCRHELESLDGIVLVSRANQAAAFDRIARSSRSWRTSRRSRRSSSRSSVVSPSVRARVKGCVLHPVADRLRRGFELASQFFRRSSLTDQLDDPLPEFRRVRRMASSASWTFLSAPTMGCPRNRINSRVTTNAKPPEPQWLRGLPLGCGGRI